MIRPILLLIALAVTALQAEAADSNAIPKSFKAYIGGFGSESYRIELQGREILYLEFVGNPNRGKRQSIEPTPEQWAKFRAALDKIPVWAWKPRYANKHVMDGTHWAFAIEYGDHSLAVEGSNAYPEKNGSQGHRPEYTAPFKAWLDAVRELLGGSEFH
jgi:hypothetical protein